MKVGFVIFENLTALDFVGVYDPVTRLKSMNLVPEMEWEICAMSEEVRDDKGLGLRATQVGEPLGQFDLLIVPGGFGTRPLLKDTAFVDWMRSGAPCPLKASVCTGSLLFGAAGFLQGKRATTHPNAFESLRPYCAEVSDERIVDEGDIITARGVTSGIDLGLYLCEKFAGVEATDGIRKQMDYPYRANQP